MWPTGQSFWFWSATFFTLKECFNPMFSWIFDSLYHYFLIGAIVTVVTMIVSTALSWQERVIKGSDNALDFLVLNVFISLIVGFCWIVAVPIFTIAYLFVFFDFLLKKIVAHTRAKQALRKAVLESNLNKSSTILSSAHSSISSSRAPQEIVIYSRP